MANLTNPFIALSVAVSLGSLSVGCATAPRTENASTEVPGLEEAGQAATEAAVEPMPRADWLNAFPARFATGLCVPGEMFLACYPITAEDCTQRAQAVASACGKQREAMLPAALGAAEQSDWGGEIGMCASQELQRNLSGQYAIQVTDACERAVANETEPTAEGPAPAALPFQPDEAEGTSETEELDDFESIEAPGPAVTSSGTAPASPA